MSISPFAVAVVAITGTLARFSQPPRADFAEGRLAAPRNPPTIIVPTLSPTDYSSGSPLISLTLIFEDCFTILSLWIRSAASDLAIRLTFV
ncbi:unnamed protein product [Soboliphyme baturini]|uniref:Secreted protein n=1 Tax=Soboliphyme baturini TaxID=241478 RepID=A0A183IXZ4_9BILA|nr:unnamed protein product [Soboliphyme baturini]